MPELLRRTVRSEWIKLSTMRSTRWAALALVVVGAGFTAIICGASADDIARGTTADDPGLYITQGMYLSQVLAVTLGVLIVTSELGTGLIRATLAATPERTTVLVAKAMVLSGSLFVTGTITGFIGYFAGNAFFRHWGIGMSLGDPHLLRSLVGFGLYLAAVGLFSGAVGLLVRHTAAAISIVLAMLFILGQVLEVLPGVVGEWSAKLMPGNAGQGIAAPVRLGHDVLSPWGGFAVLVVEIAVLAILGARLFQQRDA